MRLLELRRVLGAHAGTTAVLWDPMYRAIGEQLARLTALAARAAATPGAGQITPAVAEEVSAIVAPHRPIRGGHAAAGLAGSSAGGAVLLRLFPCLPHYGKKKK